MSNWINCIYHKLLLKSPMKGLTLVSLSDTLSKNTESDKQESTYLIYAVKVHKGHVAFHDYYVITVNSEVPYKIMQSGHEPLPSCSRTTVCSFSMRVNCKSWSAASYLQCTFLSIWYVQKTHEEHLWLSSHIKLNNGCWEFLFITNVLRVSIFVCILHSHSS